MKKSSMLMATVLLGCMLYGQAPHSLNYQTVVRGPGGQPVANNTPVQLRFTIHDGSAGGVSLFTETVSANTNQLGLVNVAIGGTVSLGTVDWGSDLKFLQVEANINGAGFVDMGTSQLLSVPYALSAGNVSGTDAYVPRFDGNNALANSLIYDNGTGIGIGTTSPGARLEVNANSAYVARFNGTSSAYFQVSEANVPKAYMGSYSGAADDADFGTVTPNANGKVHLVIEATPKMTIDHSGHVGLKTTTPRADLDIEQSGGSSSNQQSGGINLRNPTGDWEWRIYNSGDFVRFNYSNDSGASYTAKAYISSSDGSWNQLSDARMKRDLQPIGSVLPSLLQLQALKYHYIDNAADAPLSMGFLAQEVQQLFPEVVSHEKNESLLGIDYGKFAVIAIKAIQEQQQLIKQLEQRVKELESK